MEGKKYQIETFEYEIGDDFKADISRSLDDIFNGIGSAYDGEFIDDKETAEKEFAELKSTITVSDDGEYIMKRHILKYGEPVYNDYISEDLGEDFYDLEEEYEICGVAPFDEASLKLIKELGIEYEEES